MKRRSNTILTKFVETDIMRSLYSGNKNGNIPFEENWGDLLALVSLLIHYKAFDDFRVEHWQNAEINIGLVRLSPQ